MKRGQIIGLVAIMAVIVSGSWGVAQERRGDPHNGQAVYEQHCLACHGDKLDGHGPTGAFLIVPPANFQSPKSRAKTDWELLMIISHGIAFSPMHAWREKLTDQQILDVLSYIRTVAPFDAVS